jgi:hypothetical protein
MKKLAFGALLAGAFALAACGDDAEQADARVIIPPTDAAIDSPVAPGACNPVAQTGCATGEKCTWLDETADLGRIACVPDGTAAIGEACTSGAPGPTTGFDTCAAGGYCIASVCSEICTEAPDSCAEGSSCTVYTNLFDAMTGACSFNCNPVTQERATDNAPACGSPNVADPTLGCFGQPNSSFSCKPAIGPDDFVHGHTAVQEDGNIYANGCVPGNFVAHFYGQETATCTAYCQPAESNSEVFDQINGVPGHSCAENGAPNAECRYWWSLESEIDTEEFGIGYCYEYTTLFVDANQNGVFDPGEEAKSCRDFTPTQDDDANGIFDYIEQGCGEYPVPKMAVQNAKSILRNKLPTGTAEKAKAFLSH